MARLTHSQMEQDGCRCLKAETLNSFLEEVLVDLTPSLGAGEGFDPYLLEVVEGELDPYLLEVVEVELDPCLLEAAEELGPYSLVAQKGLVREPMVGFLENVIHLIHYGWVMGVEVPVLASKAAVGLTQPVQ